MKKIITFVFTIFLICSCSVAVSAEEAKYNTAGDLYEAWCDNLPDYICGVWSTDGGTNNLTFGIQNNALGNAGKQEMLELVKNDSTLTFVYQEYSRNYLLQIQREIDNNYLSKDIGLISTALDDRNNCIVLGILEERENDAETQTMINEITGKYGKAISFIYDDYVYMTTGQNELFNAQHFLFFTITLVIIMFVGIHFALQKKRMLLLQTTSGDAVSVPSAPSKKEVEEMVRKTNYDIPSDLEHKIMSEINKKV